MGINKIFLTLFVLVMSMTSMYGQIDENKIMKKWKAVEIISVAGIDNPNSQITVEDAKKLLLQTEFDIREDHSFNGKMVLPEDTVKLIGSWKLIGNKVFVYDNILEFRIIELQSDYIIISIEDHDMILMTFKMK